MSHGHRAPYSSPRASLWWCFCLAALISITIAQSERDAASSVRILTSTAAMTVTRSPTSISYSRLRTSMKISYISARQSNSTAPSTSTSPSISAGPTNTPPELFPSATDTDPHQTHTDGIFNYYFLFLALFGLLTAVFLWWVHKRRKRRKEQMRLSGHHALERDTDGWINTRRWFPGVRRYNQTAAFIRREEGLNEHGEAPPPYQPKGDIAVAQATDRPQAPASGLTIPLRTLPRAGIERGRPPEYQESLSHGESSTSTRDPVDFHARRPGTSPAS